MPRKWFFVCFGLMATLWIWSYGRADWIHMVFCVPILFFLGAHEVDWRAERLRPALVKAWIIIACAAALLRWSVWWIHHPPSLAQVLSLDSMVVRKSAPAILGHLPSIQGRKPPVVFLPHGSTLYFYWAPVPPPLDLLFPPSDKYNAPWEYSRMAEFIQKNGIPYVLIEPGFAKPFIDEPTDLARLLKRDFRQAGSSRLGTLFERKSNGHPPP